MIAKTGIGAHLRGDRRACSRSARCSRALGAWQLAPRGDEPRDARAVRRAASTDDVLAALPSELDDAERFRRVEVGGEYVARAAVPARQHAARRRRRLPRADGVARCRVARERVLVNRGWVPAGGDRRVLPDVAVAGASRGRVAGRLERLPRPGLAARRRGRRRRSGRRRRRAPIPDGARSSRERLGEPVFDYQLLLDAGAPDGYVREWRAPGVAPERHLAYAGQWLALAIGAAGAAVVMTFRTLRRKP